MGIKDPAVWFAILSASSAVLALVREKIRADNNRALAELALQGSKPSERDKIINSLAKTKQFSPMQLPRRSPRQVESPPVDHDAS